VTRDELVELTGDDELLFADGFDDCILGVTAHQPGRPQVAVYDARAMLRQLVDQDGLTEEDAQERLSYVFGACGGSRRPVYIHTEALPVPSGEEGTER